MTEAGAGNEQAAAGKWKIQDRKGKKGTLIAIITHQP